MDTLFIIDDDKTFQFIMKHNIKATKLVNNIVAFENGKEAIEYLESIIDTTEKIPDMILLDLSMPVMDGWSFLEYYFLLKPRFNKNVPIYIVSSSINPVDFQKAKSISTVTDYILKPVSKDTLVKIIENI